MDEIIKQRMSPDRRMFLKSSGLAVIASALPAGAESASSAVTTDVTAKKGRTQASSSRPVDLVNILQGTDSSGYFSRGNTLPIAALPFGMAHWTLQSRSSNPWFFQPDDRRIQGFRCTHQLSPWLSDYGQAVFLPFSGQPNPERDARAASWRPERAKLHPYSMRFSLARYQADVELIPTERCALITAQFESKEPRGFLFEVPGKSGTIKPDAGSRTIVFESKANSGGVPENFSTWYVIRFAEPWESFEVHETHDSRIGILRFSAKPNAVLEARIATSFISSEQAEKNLTLELGSTSVEQLRSAAADTWDQHLRRIEVEGGTEEQRKIFYSCLYRALLFPRIWHERDEAGGLHHFSPYNGKVEAGPMYADHGYWDVYRAWYPLMSIVFPERLAEILQSWINAYREGGWLPQFPCPGYRACMTGSLIDSVFGDAAAKGIGGFDLAAAYEGLKKHATHAGNPDAGYGRRGIEDYLQYSYAPADRVDQSVAETTDAAYGDFCIAQVAKALGRNDDAAMFLKRSENWRNVFDPATKFLRGKKADGSWLEPFDPFTWGSPYVEGSAWQHRWDVPHQLPALIDAMGGKTAAAAALEEMLSLPPRFNVGVYGSEIHEMSEMAAVDFGQYAHSNQPVHHLLYIFAAAGRRDRTQYWVRRVMKDLYTLETFAGDEDTGSMAAWFIFSAMGFYPVCPGIPEYTLGSPLFDKVTLRLPEGRQTIIEARGQSDDAVYVSQLTVNGAAHRDATIRHEEIARGAQLTFSMRNTPQA